MNLYDILEYHIFDCPTFIGGYHERYTRMSELFVKYFKNNKWIKLCGHKLIKNESEIEENLQLYIQNGYEGLMVNIYDGKYEEKRSKNLLKFKLFLDEEFEIVNITEGQGNRSKMLGYFTLKLKDGQTFDANARGNEEKYRQILLEKDDIIGKTATVRFQNYTPDNIPRFPVVISIRDYE